MIALAGDYFGPVSARGEISKSICLGETVYDRRKLLMFYYSDFTGANRPIDPDYLRKIDAFWASRLADRKTPFPWRTWTAKALDYAKMNLDHFADVMVDAPERSDLRGQRCAHVAYRTAHQAAIDMASEARQKTDDTVRKKMLIDAYGLNSWADHFLTDMFAPGHLRTPRQAILKKKNDCSWKQETSVIHSGLLANQMHDEDNMNGLIVKNSRGDVWWAYGDSLFFDPRNGRNRQLLAEAVQTSVQEVVFAYCRGARTKPEVVLPPLPSVSGKTAPPPPVIPVVIPSDGVARIWPDPGLLDTDAFLREWNPCPRFKLSEDDILRRVPGQLYPKVITFPLPLNPQALAAVPDRNRPRPAFQDCDYTKVTEKNELKDPNSPFSQATRYLYLPSAKWSLSFRFPSGFPGVTVTNAKSYTNWSPEGESQVPFPNDGLGFDKFDDPTKYKNLEVVPYESVPAVPISSSSAPVRAPSPSPSPAPSPSSASSRPGKL